MTTQTQVTEEQMHMAAEAILATTLPGLKDSTVERHYWAVLAITAEVMLEQASDKMFADLYTASDILEIKQHINDLKANAVNHAPVPEGKREMAETMYKMMLFREEHGIC